ncbi:LptF/LptG family permease [Stratiformator vulcanicus]|uniref:Putative permease YjgP/YjgQ family protein n=1 Tax=Stratiformator vulcanicus TaxID=2527980 RepID=A0A517QZR9_9PLAN|nr:LptF/LptG family permease [Stratiformator vulcanicus]QDT37146.1 putative permease YjgP/YjgQ family protein [Stratiformator vulcanicus]
MIGTCFDRYLIARYIHVFVIFTIGTLGLVSVIDLLDNVDDFTSRCDTTQELLLSIAKYYFFLSLAAFEVMGGPVALLALCVVLWTLQRNRELPVMLAAGVPTVRIAIPLVGCVGFAILLVIADQELVIPQIAHQLSESRGAKEATGHKAEAVYDRSSGILIQGRNVFLKTKTLSFAEFVLPAPSLVDNLSRITAEKARYVEPTGDRPGGWWLKNPSPSYEELALTDAGQSVVRKVAGESDIFVISAVTCTLLHKRDSSFTRMSIAEQFGLLKSGAIAESTCRRIRAHLHQRMTLLPTYLAAACLVVPLMIRREASDGPLAFARSILAAGVAFGILQGCGFLAHAGIVPGEAAAWTPICFCASAATWFLKDIAT